jgi:hypothetical protein
LIFGAIILLALLAFEIFNFSTTEFALKDLLGDLSFMGIFWATILAIAFCGIDFAGIARLFTPEEGKNEPMEVWYLFGAWMLAAVMNAILTWWGVSIAILNNDTLGSAVIGRPMLLRVVPIFVALMVWLIRVLIIGSFSLAGERLFSMAASSVAPPTKQPDRGVASARPSPQPAMTASSSSTTFRPAPKPGLAPENAPRPEPTYAPLHATAPHSSSGRVFAEPASTARSGQENDGPMYS